MSVLVSDSLDRTRRNIPYINYAEPPSSEEDEFYSDEEIEDNEVEGEKLDDDDIEGQEDITIEKEGEVKITPFNLKEEQEEGHFAKDGNFVWKKEKEVNIFVSIFSKNWPQSFVFVI